LLLWSVVGACATATVVPAAAHVRLKAAAAAMVACFISVILQPLHALDLL